jgi:hypothetical protein
MDAVNPIGVLHIAYYCAHYSVYNRGMELSKLERLLKPVSVPLKVKEEHRLALTKHPDFRHVDDVELYHQAKQLAPSVLVTDRASAIAVILSNRYL